MIIILSGAETIHKKFLARFILSRLLPPTKLYDTDYTISLYPDPFVVTDPTGRVVYGPQIGDTPSTHELLQSGDPAQKHIFDLANKYYSEVLLEGVRNSHFQNFFLDVEYDFGIDTNHPPLWETRPSFLVHPHQYEDVVRVANDGKPIHVFTGSFSRRFIDKFKQDMGSRPVLVYNIIRNPSVVYTLHDKGPDYYDNPTKGISHAADDRKVMLAMANCVKLSQYEDVITLRFEDIVAQGYIPVEDVNVDITSIYTPYNQWITTWEKDHISQEYVSKERIDQWHAIMNNFDGFVGAGNVPHSIFEALGYTQLTYKQITAAPKTPKTT